MSIRADSRCNVRSVESDDNIVISFKYSYDSQNQRFFNFKRNKNEELKQTFARISLNINNSFSKKIKRKNKNKEIKDITLEPIVAQLLVDGKNVSQELKNIDVWKEGIV
jgi:L-lysine 2,3-aminomutase